MFKSNFLKSINMRLILLSGLLLAGLTLQAQQYNSSQRQSQNSQVGTAVYYADYLHGRITAMGEVYRREAYTAAHKTYPKGTLLRVTHLNNGLSTVVRVNDRGSFGEDVLIDLSKAAAMDIGLLKDGRAKVRVEVVGRSDKNPRGGQLASASGSTALPQSYSNNSQRRSAPNYSSRSYEPTYPAAVTKGGYASRVNPDPSTSTGSSRRYSAYQSAPPAGRAYTERVQPETSNYADPNRPVTPGQTYYEYPEKNDLTAKGGYTSEQPQSYGQVGGALSSRAPGASAAAPRQNNTAAARSLPRGTSGYAVQVGSYRNADNAARQANQLKQQGLENVFVINKGGLQRVVIAPFSTKAGAQRYLDDLRRSYLIDGLVTLIR